MATTWMKAIHRGGGIAAALSRPVDYIENPDKTNGGELIDSFECDPATAQEEFLFSKRLYEKRTGRDQGKHDVIAYHIRMSFRHGEVTAQHALELGRELAMRWTKGKHQFIVAAHTNTNNPHAHIIFDSVDLDCTHKFADFKRSAIALRRVSDRICLEHGLSIIEKPGLSKGYNRAEYLGEKRAPSIRDQLRNLMDAAISACKDYDGFLGALQAAGIEIKRGKQLAFKLPAGKKFTRQDTLGDDYSMEAIIERIHGKRIPTPRKKTVTPVAPVATSTKPSLLIDIQAKMQQGYSEGYRHWAAVFNLKESAKTLIYLQERGITSYDLLSERAAAATKTFNDHGARRKVLDARLKEIAELQKHIGAYSKTREVYRQYRDGGWSRKFYSEHKSEIDAHRASKKHFDGLGFGKDKKLPPMQLLRQEYATLNAERRTLSRNYRAEREEMTSLLMAKQNVDRILGQPRQPERTQEREAR